MATKTLSIRQRIGIEPLLVFVVFYATVHLSTTVMLASLEWLDGRGFALFESFRVMFFLFPAVAILAGLLTVVHYGLAKRFH